MADVELDRVDRAILLALGEDARNNTNATISERVSVSASTVGKRIKRLEDSGVIRGYHPAIDYERVGYPLNVLFVCRASIADRSDLVRSALDVPGVVAARELMTGERNVHLLVVGTDNEDITRVARSVDELGLSVIEEPLVCADRLRPGPLFENGSE